MTSERVILKPFDWRYSAAIAGLVEYLKWLGDKAPDWELMSDRLEYHSEYITEAEYLKFVEYKYSDDMHHVVIENILQVSNPNEDQIKLVNDKLSANKVLKKIYGKTKYDGVNGKQIQQILDENREEIIRETFRNKVNLYRNYCNTNQLFEPSKDCCRLLGYYVDMPKKGKSMAYNFNMANFVGTDDLVFDFIPFAFHGERDFFFINDNIDLKNLIRTNERLNYALIQEKKEAEENGKSMVDARQVFFRLLIETKDFIQTDVEVIVKDIDKTHFETLYLRKTSLGILQNLNKSNSKGHKIYQCFCIKIKITDNYKLAVYRKVTDAIINLVLVDDLINYFLKNNKEGNYTYLTSQLIRLNLLIKGDREMDKGMKSAYACAKRIVQKREGKSFKVQDNKLAAYRQKLTSTLTFEDYDRFCKLLLNLSNYADETFDFAYDLFEDFEKNKELAYGFVNALRRDNYKEEN